MSVSGTGESTGVTMARTALLLAALLLPACDPEPDPILPTTPTPTVPPAPAIAPIAIAPDGYTFIAGDRRRFFCPVELFGWGLSVGNLVPLGYDPTMFFAGQTRPPL